jgi:hypothetical protein
VSAATAARYRRAPYRDAIALLGEGGEGAPAADADNDNNAESACC